MNQSMPDGSPEDQLTKLLESLTPEQQEAIRRKLNEKAEKAWNEQFDKLSSKLRNAEIDSGETIAKRFASALQHLSDRLSSGNIDQDIKQACSTVWHTFVQIIQSQPDDQEGKKADPDDPQIQLEWAYNDAQANLIQLRQAVAQGIAAEKQLEQQMQKNKEQATTWQNRAAMATQQHNDDLCKQAMQRKEQYANAALELEKQYLVQKEALVKLRDQYTKVEAQVQSIYTKKQILFARQKAALATAKANEILARNTTSGALSLLERMEQKVAEKEAIAFASQVIDSSESSKATPETEIGPMLAKAVASIDRLASVIERLECQVIGDESKAGVGRS